MVICEKHKLVFLGVKVQDFVRVTEDEGEKIAYYAVTCPCCIEDWRLVNLLKIFKKKTLFSIHTSHGKICLLQ